MIYYNMHESYYDEYNINIVIKYFTTIKIWLKNKIKFIDYLRFKREPSVTSRNL